MKDELGELIFPSSVYCLCCGKYTDRSRTYSLCNHCIEHMNFNMTYLDSTGQEDAKSRMNEERNEERYIDSAAAAMGYGLYERQLIFGLKYEGRTYIARHIADIMYDCLKKCLAETGCCPWLMADIIVPVPLHKDRIRERGFNQAEKIAVHFGKKTGIEVCGDGLLRTKNTKPQRALSARERMANLEDAFIVNPRRARNLKDKRVLLIDDIYTTGATAVSCAKSLKEAGIKRVDFFALSSALNKSHGEYAKTLACRSNKMIE